MLPLYLIEYSATPLKQPIIKPTTGVSRDLKPNPFEEVQPDSEAGHRSESEPEPDSATSKTSDPLLQKLGAAASAGGGAQGAQEAPEMAAVTPRNLPARRECSDSELIAALRKIRASNAGGAGEGKAPGVPSIGCKKIREIGVCCVQL